MSQVLSSGSGVGRTFYNNKKFSTASGKEMNRLLLSGIWRNERKTTGFPHSSGDNLPNH